MIKGKVLEAQLVGTLSVVWGIILDMVIIGFLPDFSSLVGCLLITGVTFYLVIEKKYRK